MVNWPAVIKLQGDDELIYIPNATAWEQDPDLSGYHYNDNDRLIDSCGNSYSLVTNQQSKTANISPCNMKYNSVEFCELLKAHFLCLQHCCVSKFFIKSIDEGMLMLQNQN